jgi:hypothetical protein
VYVTEQVDFEPEIDASAHWAAPNDPPPTAENVTGPVGAEASPPFASATVAVHVDASVAATGEMHSTFVVDARRLTAIEAEPLAVTDPESEGSIAVIVCGPADPTAGVYRT